MCGHIVSAVAHSLPTTPAYNFDTMQYDTTNLEKLLEPPHLLDDLSKKYQSAKTGLSQAVEYSIPIVQSILQRPAQENIADVTQCIVDGIFIHGIGKALSYGATFAKVYLTGAAETMAEVIAPQLMHEPFHFATTSTGDIVACIDRTGEIISDVAQVAGAAVVDGTMLVAQGNNLYNKVNNFGGNGGKQGGGDKGKLPVTPEYTYKHGTYDGVGYHKKGKTTNLGGQTKSPGLEDGQKCLDNSYGLDKYVDRIAIEDNKYVVLYSSNDGTYHGFVCSEWKDVPKNMQEIFREHKLVHPKSGALKK